MVSLLFIALILIFKPWYEEEYKNERRKLGKYVLLSTFIIQMVQLFFNGFMIYTFLLCIANSITTYIFYKILKLLFEFLISVHCDIEVAKEL